MLAIIASADAYLGGNLSQIVTTAGIRMIRTADIERIIRELKKPDRMVIVDVNWEAVQERGVLKQIVNVSRITGNKVVCICPNQEEDLKKLAQAARADEVFIRYDLEGKFKEYLRDIQLEKPDKS